MSLTQVADPSRRLLLGSLGAGVSMLLLGALDTLVGGALAMPTLAPPFGASVMIVFLLPESPVGRPWNAVVGQVASASVASAVLFALPEAPLPAQAALSVAGAGALMYATRSFHPPGGATALLLVVAEQKLGFTQVVGPLVFGALVVATTRHGLDRTVAWHAARLGSRHPSAGRIGGHDAP